MKGYVDESLDRATGRSLAVVLGAGICAEVPLEKLASQFDRLVLVDTDPEIMEFAISGMASETLRKKIELVEGDVSTVAEGFVRAAEMTIRRLSKRKGPKKSAKAVLTAIVNSLNSGKREGLPVAEGEADFVYSSDVLQNLLTMPVAWVEECYGRKFRRALSFNDSIDISQLLYKAVNAHFAEISRLMGKHSIALVETCIYRGPLWKTTPLPR